jgi:hypothetical protein
MVNNNVTCIKTKKILNHLFTIYLKLLERLPPLDMKTLVIRVSCIIQLVIKEKAIFVTHVALDELAEIILNLLNFSLASSREGLTRGN